MSNLFPPEALKAVRGFYRARFVLVGSLVLIAGGLIALLALVPAYSLVNTNRAAANDLLGSAASSSLKSNRNDLIRAQQLVKELRPIASSTVSVLEVLADVLGARPPGLVVLSVNFARGNPGTITLNGTAPSRDEINAYRTVLAKDPRFKSVSVPIGVLAGSDDGHFSLTLKGTF